MVRLGHQHLLRQEPRNQSISLGGGSPPRVDAHMAVAAAYEHPLVMDSWAPDPAYLPLLLAVTKKNLPSDRRVLAWFRDFFWGVLDGHLWVDWRLFLIVFWVTAVWTLFQAIFPPPSHRRSYKLFSYVGGSWCRWRAHRYPCESVDGEVLLGRRRCEGLSGEDGRAIRWGEICSLSFLRVSTSSCSSIGTVDARTIPPGLIMRPPS